MPESFDIRITDEQTVSALLLRPPDARAAFVLAHGAGAGMTHPFMQTVADGLAQRRMATLRFQFPYMQRGSKRPDAPALAQATVRAAVEEAARRLPGLPLIAGGKSFGARMTSQAFAASPLPGVCGLAFLGFPLHPAGRPTVQRAAHLSQLNCPMWFAQGTRDDLADASLIREVVQGLGDRATLEWLDGADHSFHVLRRSGRSDPEVMQQLLDGMLRWFDSIRAQ
jgi:predicted alpha/beta-hydrolase family hydrolase